MWNSQNTFDGDIGFAVRLVLTGHATVQQAAALCRLSVSELQALLDCVPQPRLQEVEHSH
ncbi:MAG TPA: hypothetical protein VED01_27485 [Burkholderiales bacterium]|nr:hypothetical protein [Burkholderiales bacterium]